MACRWWRHWYEEGNIVHYYGDGGCSLTEKNCFKNAARASCSIPHLRQYNVCGHINLSKPHGLWVAAVASKQKYFYMVMRKGYRHDGTKILCPKCVEERVK